MVKVRVKGASEFPSPSLTLRVSVFPLPADQVPLIVTRSLLNVTVAQTALGELSAVPVMLRVEGFIALSKLSKNSLLVEIEASSVRVVEVTVGGIGVAEGDGDAEGDEEGVGDATPCGKL